MIQVDCGKLLRMYFQRNLLFNPSAININGNILESNDDISNGFNRHFVDIARVLIERSGGNSTDDFHINVNDVVGPRMNLPHLSCEFVNNEILKMSSNKATGLDDISVKTSENC